MNKPCGVIAIGVLFIIAGLYAIYSTVESYLTGRINLNFAFLMLPVGIGLIHGKASSCFLAKFWIGLFSFTLGLLVVLYPFFGFSYHVNLFSRELTGISRHLAAMLFPSLFFIPAIIMWRYLSRPDVQAYFGE